MLSGVGVESCEQRADCREGLHCVHERCVDEAAYQRSLEPEPKRALGYVGAAIGLGVPAFWHNFGTTFPFALRAGVIIGGVFKLQADVSPMTTVFTGVAQFEHNVFAAWDAVGSIGFLVPLGDMVSWVVQVGGGGGTFVDSGASSLPFTGFGELRVDLFGVTIRTSKHVLLEFNVPSYRMYFPPPNNNNGTLAVAWVTSIAASYAF